MNFYYCPFLSFLFSFDIIEKPESPLTLKECKLENFNVLNEQLIVLKAGTPFLGNAKLIFCLCLFLLFFL